MVKYLYIATVIAASSLLASCSTQITALPTQTSVDLKKYEGVWYEQALLPNRFQKECVANVRAEYTLLDADSLRVKNQCEKADGSLSVATGIGRLNSAITPPEPAILEVRFAPDWLGWLPKVWGDYWIIKVEDNYQYALVGSPDRDYLWVLSRAKKADLERVDTLLEYAGTLGFDVGQVQYTKQNVSSESLGSP